MIQFFRQLILQDFWLKLFSLALATLIWLTVSIAIHKKENVSLSSLTGSPTEQTLTFFNISIKVVAEAADVSDFKVSPTTVQVRVRGEQQVLQKLQASQIRALVDLTESTEPGSSRRIEVTAPPGITVVEIIPDSATITVPQRH